MKKYLVKDEDGKKVEVEELDSCKDENENPDKKDLKDDEITAFSAEEIVALKKLLPVIDKIVALASQPAPATDEDKDVKDEDEDKDPEDKADVIDTDADEEKDVKGHDSKKSFGANQAKKVAVDDSFDKEEAIAKAWSSR